MFSPCENCKNPVALEIIGAATAAIVTELDSKAARVVDDFSDIQQQIMVLDPARAAAVHEQVADATVQALQISFGVRQLAAQADEAVCPPDADRCARLAYILPALAALFPKPDQG